jgi:putative transposase
MLARRLELDPNNAQATYFRKACGSRRVAFNWAIEQGSKQYEAAKLVGGHGPSEVDLRRQLNACKRTDFPWMLEVSKQVIQQAVRDYGTAMKGFFAKRTKYPRFKKRGENDSFYVEKVRFDSSHVVLPKLGKVRLKERPPEGWAPSSAHVSHSAGRWYLSVLFKATPAVAAPITTKSVGVDLGITSAITTSDGLAVDAPKPLKTATRILAHLQKMKARCRGVCNRRKIGARVARVLAQTKRIRSDFWHKVTTRLVRENQTIVIEDLNVSGMLKNHCLARAVSDVGFYEFRRQIEYKCVRYGRTLVVADQWFPSSKTCSTCGVKKDSLSLSDRTFHCEACGFLMDRDLNAALNLLALSNSATKASDGSAATLLVARSAKQARRVTKSADSDPVKRIA